MLDDQTVAVIGAGNIGRALIGGMIHSELIAPEQLIATRRTPSALDDIADQFPGLRTTTDNAAAADEASILLLTEIRDHVDDGVLVISVLAGVTAETLQYNFGHELPVIRAMPNTPALVDEGATALAPGTFASEEHVAMARRIFEAVGEADVVPEYLMDAVTGLSGIRVHVHRGAD